MATERNKTWLTRTIRLAQDVTWDLFNNPYRPAYSLLHKSGEYLRVAATGVVVVSTWPEALLHAQQMGAEYIVSFKEKRVFFRKVTASGTTWMPACPIPHPSIEIVNQSEAVPYEPQADGSQPQKKRPSGSQNRRRYGGR